MSSILYFLGYKVIVKGDKHYNLVTFYRESGSNDLCSCYGFEALTVFVNDDMFKLVKDSKLSDKFEGMLFYKKSDNADKKGSYHLVTLSPIK